MTYKTILYAVEQNVLTLTLNRPERLNAFTRDMAEEMIDAFDRSDADDDVRAVVVTGAGRAFCAGADLEAGAATFNYARTREKPLSQEGPGGRAVHRDGGGVVALRIYRSLKPVIAAINGPAVGVGLTMTLPMDIRLASEASKFGFVFTRRGITPEAASSFFLPRLVGVSRAMEWCASGRVFPAADAKDGGLVRSLHAPEALLPAAYSLAREIADNAAPVSVALTRQMMWRSFAWGHPMEAHEVDSRAIASRGASADAREGIQSFFDKRPARFEDRVSKDLPDIFPYWREPEFT